jgi:hypothetical protein
MCCMAISNILLTTTINKIQSYVARLRPENHTLATSKECRGEHNLQHGQRAPSQVSAHHIFCHK